LCQGPPEKNGGGPPKKTREAKKKMFLIKHFVANGVHLGHKVDE